MVDYQALYVAERNKCKTLAAEMHRLKQLMPETVTEIRARERILQERMSRYEQAIIDYENEQKALRQQVKQKDEDIAFIKNKYEETNTLWHQENLEKQKLEAVIEQQYRESMELDTLRRKLEDERSTLRTKNN